MAKKVLLRVPAKGRALLVTDGGIELEEPKSGIAFKRQTQRFYDITEIHLRRGLMSASLEILGEKGTILLEGISADDGEKLIALIESKRGELPAGAAESDKETVNNAMQIADELRKLSEMKESGELSESEYEQRRRNLLGRH